MEIRTGGRFIVTGAAGGIAESVIAVFSEAGAELGLAGHHLADVRSRAHACGAVALEADLTKPEAAEAMVREAHDRLGRIDGLIHTVGGFAMAPAHETDIDSYQKMVDVNLRTLVVATGAVLPVFLEQGGGFLAGFSAAPGWQRSGGASISVYAAVKAAVAAYLHAVQAETGPQGVTTTVVYPMGVVETPGNRESMPDADRSTWIDPSEIAKALLLAAVSGPKGRLRELPIFPAG